jgi:2-succinyl-5-enolpyruvyl-6-hydroxy-3-cyclohexene-1-carboxylate synthase
VTVLTASDPQSQWAEQLLAGLRDAGVHSAVISPGSRSTPLVWAATRTAGLECHVVIDERSAGFYALGQARVSGVPSLLICTSGTALSHYYPAVIEARESGTPLVVLSADRPFELAHVGAHQTIDQTRIFGAYATYHELGTPIADVGAVLALRRTAWQAVEAALAPPRGAVHLNFRAKKPLEPLPAAVPLELPELTSLAPLRARRPISIAREELDWVISRLRRSECPLLICGPMSILDSPPAELVQRFAALSGAVICAEAVSQLRFRLGGGTADAAVCDACDWLLDSAKLAARLRPDFILQLGMTPVSAALGRVLEGAGQIDAAVCAESGWPDPLHKGAQIVRGRPRELLLAVCDAWSGVPPPARPRRETWLAANRVARGVIDAHVERGFGEAAAVVTVCEALPAGSILVLGNSLPPRLVDRYCAASRSDVRVCSQRGASGIEGAIAGALGAASQTGDPVTLLVGDISFLHDVGSLWAADPARTLARPSVGPVTIVVLNNDGGRIFEELPIAARAGIDFRFWTTPHTLRLAGAAELYALPFARAESREELHVALKAAQLRPGVSLIEVKVAPDSAKDSLRDVRAELDRALPELASDAGS